MISANLVEVLDNLCKTNKNTNVCMCTHTHTHTHAVTNTHTHTHTHIHTEEADDKELSNFKLPLAQH